MRHVPDTWKSIPQPATLVDHHLPLPAIQKHVTVKSATGILGPSIEMDSEGLRHIIPHFPHNVLHHFERVLSAQGLFLSKCAETRKGVGPVGFS